MQFLTLRGALAPAEPKNKLGPLFCSELGPLQLPFLVSPVLILQGHSRSADSTLSIV